MFNFLKKKHIIQIIPLASVFEKIKKKSRTFFRSVHGICVFFLSDLRNLRQL